VISSSSVLPETSSRPLKSAAWNLPQNGSAHRSLWFKVIRDAELATLEELMRPREKQSRNLRSIVDRIRRSVEGLLATELRHDSARTRPFWISSLENFGTVSDLVCGRANVRANGVLHKDLMGTEYSLETGCVDFFDGVPEAG
jgi:hypothetical protein